MFKQNYYGGLRHKNQPMHNHSSNKTAQIQARMLSQTGFRTSIQEMRFLNIFMDFFIIFAIVRTYA